MTETERRSEDVSEDDVAAAVDTVLQGRAR
jgi:hypothetical protein